MAEDTHMTPKEWFDQFPPATDWPASSQWCARHWAPCPLMHANSIGASVEVMQAWLDIDARRGPDVVEKINARMAAGGPICCQLGDEKMYEIWGHWPPSPEHMPKTFNELPQ